METFSVEDLDKLQHEIRKILGRKLLRLLKVEDGCIELTFRVLNCADDISEHQKQALCDLGVLTVTCQIIHTDKASGKCTHSMWSYATIVMLIDGLHACSRFNYHSHNAF